ncbi:hypothetical protein H4R35_001081, partial [Dimargaris xerosporica]
CAQQLVAAAPTNSNLIGNPITHIPIAQLVRRTDVDDTIDYYKKNVDSLVHPKIEKEDFNAAFKEIVLGLQVVMGEERPMFASLVAMAKRYQGQLKSAQDLYAAIADLYRNNMTSRSTNVERYLMAALLTLQKLVAR